MDWPCGDGALVLESGKIKVIKEEPVDDAGLCIGEYWGDRGAGGPWVYTRSILPLDGVNNDINCLL